MSTYNDAWNEHAPRASVIVHEETKSVKVSYPHPSGGKPFRVMIHQKPNPIGFHVRLPGDRGAK